MKMGSKQIALTTTLHPSFTGKFLDLFTSLKKERESYVIKIDDRLYRLMHNIQTLTTASYWILFNLKINEMGKLHEKHK